MRRLSVASLTHALGTLTASLAWPLGLLATVGVVAAVVGGALSTAERQG